MDEWSQCAQCGLRHRSRADGRCPRCAGTPGVDQAAGAPDAVFTVAPAMAIPLGDAPPAAGLGGTGVVEGSPPGGLPLRIGGAALLLLSALTLYERATMPQLFEGGGFISSLWMSAVVDLLLGGALVIGVRAVLPLVLVRLALGLVVFSVLHAVQANVVGAVEQLALSGGLLLILAGHPARGRLVAGILATVLGLGIELTAVGAIKTGRNVFQEALTLHQVAPPPESGVVEGRSAAWTIPLPAQGWKLLKPEYAAKHNPLVDRWLTLPARDAQLFVIREELPAGTVIPEDALPAVLEENARRGNPGAEIVPWERVEGDGWSGLGTWITARDKGTVVKIRAVAISAPDAVYQLMGVYPVESTDAVAQDIEGAIARFRLP